MYEKLNTKSSEEEVKRVTWWENRATEKASLHLYCFHDAGGSSSLYHEWDGLNDEIELRAIELPGRGNRNGEPAVADMMQLVKSLATEISLHSPTTPFAFFGHSMGGAIAYEVMKELRSRNNSLPLMLFTSSTPALFSYNRSELSNQMDEEKLIERFPHLSAEIIKDERLRQEFIQIMREDLALLDSYQYKSTKPFELPIVSIRGEEDSSVSLEQILLWGNETTRPHEVIERPGGHRYLIDDQTYICNLINDMLLQTVEL